MSQIDEIAALIKKQKDKHYRFVRAEPANVSSRKVRGYENVSSQDPEIKGTILEKQLSQADGTVRFGNLILQRTTQENRDRLQKQIDTRNQARLDNIKRKFLREGEDLKRSLGKSHNLVNFIHEEKE